MGTNVTYNGILLRNVTTRQWDQEIIYDESGTDMIRQAFRLRFEGILHLDAVESDGNGGGIDKAGPNIISQEQTANSMSLSYEHVATQLGQARGNLQVTMNNEPILVCYSTKDPEFGGKPFEKYADADNGPKPHHVSIVHVAGNKVFRVQFSIDVTLGQQTKSSGETPFVLNNRWSVGETLDENWFTTRTIRGRMRLGNQQWPGHMFRAVVVPPLEMGFRRQSVDYVVSANGLDIDYAVIDRQVHDAAPWPATKMTGTFGESTVDGIQYLTDLHLRLEGPPNADKRMMLARGVQIAQQKMEIVSGKTADPNNDQSVGYRVVNAALVEHLGDANAVEVHFTIQHLKKDTREYLTNLWTKWLGIPLDLPSVKGEPAKYNPIESGCPDLFGYTPHTDENRNPAVLFLLGCYLQEPSGKHGIWMPDGSRGEVPTVPRNKNTIVKGSQLPGAIPENSTDNYSQSAHDFMYTHCAAESKYITRQSKVQLPIAADPSQLIAGEATSAIVTLGLPIVQREIKVDFERVGKWPELPSADEDYLDGEVRGTLLKHWIRPQPPRLSADGRTPLYRIAAYYLYALNRPPTDDERMAVGVLPFTNFTIDDTRVSGAKLYVTDLV